MNIARSSSAFRRQHGVTLIELMVSITIGLFILIAIGTAYITTTSTGRQRENQSELNEPARIVMQQLRRELSLAGYVDVMDLGVSGLLPDPDSRTAQAFALFNPSKKEASNLFQRDPLAYGALADRTPIGQFFPGLVPVFGCDSAILGNSPNAIALGGSPSLACDVPATLQNSLQVAYQVAPAATSTNASLIAPSVATGEGLDCLQQPLPAVPGLPGTQYVINRYFVQPIGVAPNQVNELVCQGSGSATVAPIARGVEEFVLRYQVGAAGAAPALSASAPALVAAGGTTAQYVNATDVRCNPSGLVERDRSRDLHSFSHFDHRRSRRRRDGGASADTPDVREEFGWHVCRQRGTHKCPDS
ncbi:MAG: prepilin-type N-terminal cleavage/methylation domain-containing protein [Rhodoferax sp.]|nr:prepilin-type N-terminal cleavage/methylation domain-containing protein [Rhodoferax sp.]